MEKAGQGMDEAAAGRGAWCAGTALCKRPGRPAVLPEADRRARLLDAAATVFLAQGYRDATMHAIALQARMSKKTLYQVFPSKLALFDALLGDRIFGLPAPPDVTGLDQEEALSRLLLAIAGVLLLPDRVGLIRLIISAGPNLPELGTAFERLRLAHDLNPLETWLAAEQARGALPAGNVVDEAQLLFGMTIAEPILKALVNAPSLAHAPSAEDSIRFAVRLFLRGLGR
jgi:TetR/AcrR family transcriptional regulator of autoinduction and epiphytic fitness